MSGPRIYTGHELHPDLLLELDPAAGRHVAGALRLRAGDQLTVFNGSGGEFAAVITAVERRSVTIRVGQQHHRSAESPLTIHLGIALSRGERMDWIVQKSTELGVTEISPLFSERCEVKLAGDRADKKLQHWRHIASSACEQCGRNTLPRINQLSSLSAWCAGTREELRLVLHQRAATVPPPGAAPASLALLIGPEGGLADAEIETAAGAGFQAVALGPRVLRTETAPLAALAIMQARWGDMSW